MGVRLSVSGIALEKKKKKKKLHTVGIYEQVVRKSVRHDLVLGLHRVDRLMRRFDVVSV